MSTHEIGIALDWLKTTLSSDTALSSAAPGGVWRGMVESGSTPPVAPYVIISFQAGTDNVTMNAFRLLSNTLFQVKAVGPAKLTTQLVTAASRIDALLSKPSSGTATGGLILAAYRDSPLQYDEPQPVAGEMWSNFGGLYRLQIQQI